MGFFEPSQIELAYLPKKSKYLVTSDLMKDCSVKCYFTHEFAKFSARIFLIIQGNIKRFSYDF
jgi:hypothetical protein